MNGPVLIIFGGLPGSGKTTLARGLADRLDATYLRIDSIEQAMARSYLKIDPAEDAGYEVGYAVAEDNLRLGRIVIADSVNPIELTRKAWRDAGECAGAQIVEIEVICTDENEHKKRVETRRPDIKGHELPNWIEVVKRDYEPWEREHIIIDTTKCSVEECVEKLYHTITNADGSALTKVYA